MLLCLLALLYVRCCVVDSFGKKCGELAIPNPSHSIYIYISKSFNLQRFAFLAEVSCFTCGSVVVVYIFLISGFYSIIIELKGEKQAPTHQQPHENQKLKWYTSSVNPERTTHFRKRTSSTAMQALKPRFFCLLLVVIVLQCFQMMSLTPTAPRHGVLHTCFTYMLGTSEFSNMGTPGINDPPRLPNLPEFLSLFGACGTNLPVAQLRSLMHTGFKAFGLW